MTKYHLSTVAGAVLCTTLAACSTTPMGHSPNQLTQKTVHYQCRAQDQRALDLEVQYAFQGNDPVTAQVIYDNQAILLTRDTGSKANLVGNTFTGDGYTWTTGQFTLDNVSQVSGNLLTRLDALPGHVGQHVNTILARNCAVRG